jgi:hypothetical protein
MSSQSLSAPFRKSPGGRTLAGAVAGLAALAATGLAGCASIAEPEAAADVRALAVALQARDRAGIERRIDRPALQTQVTGAARTVIAQQTRSLMGNSGLGTLVGLALADAGEPAIAAIVREMLEPDTLADIAALGGLGTATEIPSSGRTRLALRALDDGRVCLPGSRTGPCRLYFTDSASGWRLTAIDPDVLQQGLERRIGSNRR